MVELSVANSYGGSRHDIQCDRLPDNCPWCHKSIIPIEVSGFIMDWKSEVYYLFMCPNNECRKYFIGDYEEESDADGSFMLTKTMLGRPKPKEFSMEIYSISEDFIMIYNQAVEAEFYGLSQVCGPGFRKAIEFLIKDYLIFKTPSFKEKIESLSLSNCIDLLPDSNLKDTAKRGTWLGNDETHYKKRWVDKDISHLKTVIDLMVYWMISERLTEKLIEGMP